MWIRFGIEWPSSTRIFLVYRIHMGIRESPRGKRRGSAGISMSRACFTNILFSGWQVLRRATKTCSYKSVLVLVHHLDTNMYTICACDIELHTHNKARLSKLIQISDEAKKTPLLSYASWEACLVYRHLVSTWKLMIHETSLVLLWVGLSKFFWFYAIQKTNLSQ